MANKELPEEVVLSPEGHLELVLVSGSDLVVRDFVSSDPFCTLQMMDTYFKSRTIFACLNPFWNEKFDFLVYDKKTQIIELTVYDQDMLKAPGTQSAYFRDQRIDLHFYLCSFPTILLFSLSISLYLSLSLYIYIYPLVLILFPSYLHTNCILTTYYLP